MIEALRRRGERATGLDRRVGIVVRLVERVGRLFDVMDTVISALVGFEDGELHLGVGTRLERVRVRACIQVIEAGPFPWRLAAVVVFAFGFVFLVVARFVLRSVVVAAFEAVDAGACSEEGDVGVVVTEGGYDVVRPRLEPLHPVDEQVGVANRPLNLWPWFPAVAVLPDRDERLRRRHVAGDFAREIAEHEERCLCCRFATGAAATQAARDGTDRSGTESSRDESSSSVLRHVLLTFAD
jgi:hypothetical protein